MLFAFIVYRNNYAINIKFPLVLSLFTFLCSFYSDCCFCWYCFRGLLLWLLFFPDVREKCLNMEENETPNLLIHNRTSCENQNSNPQSPCLNYADFSELHDQHLFNDSLHESNFLNEENFAMTIMINRFIITNAFFFFSLRNDCLT